MFKFFEGGSLSRSKDSVPVGGREGAAAGLASSWESSGGRGSGLARSISSLKLGRSGHRGDRGSQEEGVDRRLDKRLSVKSSASGKGGPALRRSNTLPSKRRVSGFSHPHRDEVISGRESRTSHEGGSTTTEGSRFADTLRRLSRRVTGKRGHSRHTDEELSRGSSVCTLRHEDHEFPSHYLSVSEVATSELVSPDVSLMDLGSIDATPTISPFGSQGLAFPRQASLGSLKHVRSHAHTLSPDLSALCHILATFRDPRGCPQHEIYENVSPGHSSDLLGTNGLRPHSPASSLTSSARGEKGSGVNGRQEVGAQGHACPSCQVSFLTTLQLLDHWATFHTHDDLHTLPPRPHYGGHALEERDKSTHILPGPREGTLKEITSSQQQQQQQQQEDPTSSQCWRGVRFLYRVGPRCGKAASQRCLLWEWEQRKDSTYTNRLPPIPTPNTQAK
ncbi:hypothetical protein E2C01_059541 [Portunus trituberculatus]|uniref:C2H2-type domain-containing protein n=1 Tax=Portunus trituberculatus TaxID=210409 RepID=A0A5B7H820_PORTR|nr:hypothetical protein [Portunus trituberculatus]